MVKENDIIQTREEQRLYRGTKIIKQDFSTKQFHHNKCWIQKATSCQNEGTTQVLKQIMITGKKGKRNLFSTNENPRSVPKKSDENSLLTEWSSYFPPAHDPHTIWGSQASPIKGKFHHCKEDWGEESVVTLQKYIQKRSLKLRKKRTCSRF